MTQHNHRRFRQPELRSSQHPAMACDQFAVVRNQAGNGPAELRHAGCDLRDLIHAVRLRVFRIRLELGQRPGLDCVRGKAQGHAGRFALMMWIPWTPDTGSQPGLRKGSSGRRGVRLQEFVLLWFSGECRWMPAGVASQKIGPVAGDIARFARQHTFSAGKEPENNGLGFSLSSVRSSLAPKNRRHPRTPSTACLSSFEPPWLRSGFRFGLWGPPRNPSRNRLCRPARASPEYIQFVASQPETVTRCDVSPKILSQDDFS